MIGLDDAKVIIGRVDSAHLPAGYSEIDAAAVFEEGWIHIGEDHFYNQSTSQVAGPKEGGTRILVALAVSMEAPAPRDISEEWERQAGSERVPVPPEDTDAGFPSPLTEKSGSAGGKCACDS